MQTLTFRNVTPSDAAQIAEIYNHYIERTDISFETVPLTSDDMTARISALAAEYPYIVCEDRGRILGYAYAHRWKERAAYCHTWETTVYLRHDCTGIGIGRQLMLSLIKQCRRRDVHVLVACITATNRASLALHRNLGFVEVSHFRQVGYKHNRWLDVIDMQLTLA